MKPPYRLVPDAVSHDTVECLAQLQREAASGRLIGIAYGAIYRQRNYIVNTAGEAHRSPTFARGVIAALDDVLAHSIKG